MQSKDNRQIFIEFDYKFSDHKFSDYVPSYILQEKDRFQREYLYG